VVDNLVLLGAKDKSPEVARDEVTEEEAVTA
jgi:hypothetical protein